MQRSNQGSDVSPESGADCRTRWSRRNSADGSAGPHAERSALAGIGFGMRCTGIFVLIAADGENGMLSRWIISERINVLVVEFPAQQVIHGARRLVYRIEHSGNNGR